MKAIIEAGSITFIREKNDPKFYGMRFAKGEHNLLHFIKKWLNERGFELIKKRVQKDGHMYGDEYQPYLRSTNKRSKAPHIYIVSPFYALHGANEDWNNGEVQLALHGDVYDVQPNFVDIISKLASKDIQVKR